MLDSITPTIEAEVAGKVYRACAEECRTPEGEPVWLSPLMQAAERRTMANRATKLHRAINAAREAGDIGTIDAVTVSLKTMQETRRVLGLDAPIRIEFVNLPDASTIAPEDFMRAAQKTAREYYAEDDGPGD